MTGYEYRCPVHGVVQRAESFDGNFHHRCDRRNDMSTPCGRVLLVVRVQRSGDEPPPQGVSPSNV
jgi:hypothetical protein